MAAKLGPYVDRLLSDMGAAIEPGPISAVLAWLDRLVEWNARIDLTAARSPEELVDLMLADAVHLSARIARDVRVVDVGTGAGAPGLALALLRPDLEVTLVEPLGKRASFLRTAAGAAGRSDIAIARERVGAVQGKGPWDVATSRATLAPADWLDAAAALVPTGGFIWALLAKETAPAHALVTLEDETPYRWPLTGVDRRAVRYRRS